MTTASVNGTELHYTDSGSGGPALLFIHGMCGNANVWDGQVQRLSPHFRCIAYDRRGHTRSPLGSVEQRTVQLHADDAAALIEALRIAPCFLVGSSGGAGVAIDVVRRYPHLLRGAVLSEPPLFALDPEGARAFVAEVQPRLQRAVQDGGPRAAVDAFFEYACPGLWSRIDEQGKEPYRANHAELFADLQMPPYQVAPEDLRRIGVPCLIVSGSDSHPALKRIAAVLAGSIPGAERLELAGCGHVTYAEKPDEFARGVTEFVGRPAAQPA